MPASAHVILKATLGLIFFSGFLLGTPQDGSLGTGFRDQADPWGPLSRSHFLIQDAPDQVAVGSLRFLGRGPGPDWIEWTGGVVNEATLEADLILDPGAEFHLAFGCDPDRTRGVGVSIGKEIRLFAFRVKGPESLISVVAKPSEGAARRLRVSFASQSLRVSLSGNRTEVLRVRTPDPGRVFFGASGSGVVLQNTKFQGTLSSTMVHRLRELSDERPFPEPPPLGSTPIFLPWEVLPESELIPSGVASARQNLEEIRDAARRGHIVQAFDLAESWRRTAPASEEPSLLLAMMELAIRGNAGRARGLLMDHGGPDRPDLFRRVRAETAWRLGELDEAKWIYEGLADPHGLALVAWARGEVQPAAALCDPGAPAATDWRGSLILELNNLWSHGAWHRDETEEAIILSDVPGLWRERGLRQIGAFQTAVLRTFEQEGLPARRPVARPIVVLCARDEVFDAWNRRFGGARFKEADGLYRQGQRTIFLREDPDPLVTQRRLHHELVHHLVYHQALSLPRMLEEGLAELLAHAPLSGTELRLGEAVAPGRLKDCQRVLGTGLFPDPRSRVLGDESDRLIDNQNAYAVSWATLHWLARRRGALGAVVRAAGDTGQAPQDLLPTRETLERHLESLLGR